MNTLSVSELLSDLPNDKRILYFVFDDILQHISDVTLYDERIILSGERMYNKYKSNELKRILSYFPKNLDVYCIKNLSIQVISYINSVNDKIVILG